jgi:hypothetical protein
VTNRVQKLRELKRQVSESGKRRSRSLVGDQIAESGLLDRSLLNRQIEIILEGLERAVIGSEIEHHLESFVDCIRQGDVPGAAEHTTALLSLDMDDLRKAALLSLMVRLASKRKFDPIATYVLANRTIYVTTPA